MKDSLEQFYKQQRRGLYSLALTVTRREDLAEDALHEAVTRLCRDTDWLGRPDSKAYAYKAVRNAAIDQLRRKRVSAGEVSIFAESAEPAPPENLETAERERLVRQAVERLPAPQREALVMKVYGGLTFQEIADAMGEPLSTVASRYRRALEELRSELEQPV